MIRRLEHEQPGTPGEWFQFAIVRKGADELIEICAVKVGKGDARQAEIGFTLARAHPGQELRRAGGLAPPALGVRRAGLHRVVATTDQRKEPSSRLLGRLGMRREGSFVWTAWFKEEWASEYLYAVLGEEWLGKRGRKPGAGSP